MENEQLEQLLLSIEEKLVSFERRFSSLVKALPEDMAVNYNLEKDKLRERTGTDYSVKLTIDTDKGVKNTQKTPIIGWSQKDAEYVYWRDIAYPNLVRMRDEGKIKWFKKVKKS
jgi:hypothetical protein